MSMIAW